MGGMLSVGGSTRYYGIFLWSAYELWLCISVSEGIFPNERTGEVGTEGKRSGDAVSERSSPNAGGRWLRGFRKDRDYGLLLGVPQQSSQHGWRVFERIYINRGGTLKGPKMS